MFKPIFMNVLRYMYLGKREHYTVIHFDGRVVRAIRGKEVPKIEDQERVYMYPGWSKKIEKVVLRNLGNEISEEYKKKHHITKTIPNNTSAAIGLGIAAAALGMYRMDAIIKKMLLKKQKEEKA